MSTPTLTLRTKKLSKGVLLVTLEGSVEQRTYEEFDRNISKLLQGRNHRIVVDVSKLEYISSAGVSLFINLMLQAEEGGGRVVFVNPMPNVKKTFDLLDASNRTFAVSASTEEALQTFR
jgi:anti-anti-sigma factor